MRHHKLCHTDADSRKVKCDAKFRYEQGVATAIGEVKEAMAGVGVAESSDVYKEGMEAVKKICQKKKSKKGNVL